MSSLENFPQVFPLVIYKKKLKFKRVCWFLSLITFYLIIIFGYITSNIFLLLLCSIPIVFLILFSIMIHYDLNRLKVATLWDDFEYRGIIKQPFKFITNDGVKQYAYVYYPKNIDLKNSSIKLPVIIGLHGWGSHHREMDRYCLPITLKEQCVYFTYDAYGQGMTPGDKSDFRQVNDCKEFIDRILELSYIDRKKIIVVGMSLGATKAAVVAYPHPDIRGVILMSGSYDLSFTKKNMSKIEYLIFKMNGFNFPKGKDEIEKYSGKNFLKAEGIILRGEEKPTPNTERVLLLANKDDPVVKYQNALLAIQLLNLPPENYIIFEKGGHCFAGNEYWVSIEINYFIKYLLSEKK